MAVRSDERVNVNALRALVRLSSEMKAPFTFKRDAAATESAAADIASARAWYDAHRLELPAAD